MGSCPAEQDRMRPRRRGSAEGTGQRQRQLSRGPPGAGLGGEPVPEGQTQWIGVCVVTCGGTAHRARMLMPSGRRWNSSRLVRVPAHAALALTNGRQWGETL